jgi:glucokinase
VTGITVGVDIGGTKTAAGIVTAEGAVGPLTTVATPVHAGPDAVLQAAIDAARRTLADWHGDRVTGCGIGTAGMVGPGGIISSATDLIPGWTGTDVRGGFADALGLPVVVLNDVQAVAVGECVRGAGAGFGDVLVVAVGTGIGGALVYGGRLVTGRTGAAGSVGHLPVPAPYESRCSCGRRNHLEAFSSGPAIADRYARLSGEPVDLPEIARRALSGDAVALEVIDQAGEVLGTALGGLVNVTDPDVVVIGGGVAAMAGLLATPVKRGLAAEALPGPDHVELRFAALGSSAAVVGAALAARHDGHSPLTKAT